MNNSRLTLIASVFVVFAITGGLLIGVQVGRQEAREENAAFAIGGAASYVLDQYYEEGELKSAGILLKSNCAVCRLVALKLGDETRLPFNQEEFTELFKAVGCRNAVVTIEVVVGDAASYRVTDHACGLSQRVLGESPAK